MSESCCSLFDTSTEVLTPPWMQNESIGNQSSNQTSKHSDVDQVLRTCRSYSTQVQEYDIYCGNFVNYGKSSRSLPHTPTDITLQDTTMRCVYRQKMI